MAMNKPALKQPTPDKSDTAKQIETLLLRIGPEPSVDSWTNGNGITVCSTVRREDGKTVRIYVEGGSSRAGVERVVLDAVKSMVGGGA